MGALPQVSVVAGPHRNVDRRLLHRQFEQNLATLSADAIALIAHDPKTGDRHLSYAALNATANRYARAMRSHVSNTADAALPNPDGDWIIAVCLPPSEQLIAVLLAIWKMGAAYLPLEPSFPVQRIEHIVGEARPVLAVVCDEAAHMFAGQAYVTVAELQEYAADRCEDDLCDEETLDTITDDSRLAIVLYTSGSTGIPKGVRLPHSIIQNRIGWQLAAFPFAASERTAVFKTALTFVDSVAEIWAPLLCGLSVLILPKAVVRDPERLVDVLEAYRIERLVLVPTLLRALLMYLPLRREALLLRALRIWVCSGETLSAQLAQDFYAHFGVHGQQVLCNFYGSTEIMGDVTYYVCPAVAAEEATLDDGVVVQQQQQQQRSTGVPIGYPIDNTIVYVLDGDLRPVKVGERGELFVAGRNVAAGYVGGRDKCRFVVNPLTEDPVYDRLYRTGDYASVLADGALRYDGRTDSQIKIRGHRVDLAEVERQLLTGVQTPAIDKGLVLCHRPGEIDQALVAFVTLRADAVAMFDAAAAAAQIEAALAGRLAEYMLPQVLVVETIPLLVNGKVDRQTLLKMYANASNDNSSNGHDGPGMAFDFEGVPAQHAIAARTLFETIASAIGRSARNAVSLSANFYQLGGNSLNSIYTVTQLREMGYPVGIQEFIAASNLGEILEMMVAEAADQRTNGESKGGVDEEVDANNNEVLQFEVKPLAQDQRQEVIELMTHSFFEKADLERLLKPNIVYQDYADIFEDLYDGCCREGLSFVVYDARHNRIVGAALNTDAHCEPSLQIRSQLAVVFEFLREIQLDVRRAHPTTAPGQLFHAGMMGTSARLSAQENITAMHCMETEVLRVAGRLGYAGVFTTNTSPLTQQLASHVHGYETVCKAQVNRWSTADGWRPFAEAPDEQTALVQWKRLMG